MSGGADEIDRLVAKYVTADQIMEWRAREAAEQAVERGKPIKARKPRRRQPLVPGTDDFKDALRRYPALRARGKL